jgi:hypothetical protein
MNNFAREGFAAQWARPAAEPASQCELAAWNPAKGAISGRILRLVCQANLFLREAKKSTRLPEPPYSASWPGQLAREILSFARATVQAFKRDYDAPLNRSCGRLHSLARTKANGSSASATRYQKMDDPTQSRSPGGRASWRNNPRGSLRSISTFGRRTSFLAAHI